LPTIKNVFSEEPTVAAPKKNDPFSNYILEEEI